MAENILTTSKTDNLDLVDTANGKLAQARAVLIALHTQFEYVNEPSTMRSEDISELINLASELVEAAHASVGQIDVRSATA